MKSVEGYEVDKKILAMVEGEQPRFAARPSYVTVDAGAHWDSTTLLLTERRLVIIRDRLLRKARPDFEAAWPDVRQVEGSLWKGAGPKIQLLVHVAHRQSPVELIVDAQYASDVESAIRSGYLP